MIPQTNCEMFDDSAHEYCIHPRLLSVLTEYLSLSMTHFTPINLVNHLIWIIGPIPFQKETCSSLCLHVQEWLTLSVDYRECIDD